MDNYTIFWMFENLRRGRQARNFTTNVPKILDLKSSSEQIFSETCRWVPLKDQTYCLPISTHDLIRHLNWAFWFLYWFRNINLAANIPLLLTSCSIKNNCWLSNVKCGTISQAGKSVFHKIPAFPAMSLTKILQTFIHSFSSFFNRKTSTRSLVRSSL